MAQVIVNHNTKSYTVENALNKMEMISQDLGNGVTRKVTITNLGISLDASQDVGSRGVCSAVCSINTEGGEFGDESKNQRFNGVFDESNVNAAGFGNLLKRVATNAVFKHFLAIEPIDVSDGSVYAPY